MKTFLVIDGNSIMNRAFYGLSANMTSSFAGIHTNALYGFLNIYWMVLDQYHPDYVSVSFDLKAPTFRHQMYDAYKGTRKGMPEELAEQMPVIKELLTALIVPILELEGYEADDILGTVATENTKHDIFTYILTGDKDSFQLISDMTSIIIPTTRFGKTEYSVYTPALLKEKQNIEPYQVVHIKSLMGDSSDNIPGVKGIGEKTAYSLIEKYTTLDQIYEQIDTLEVTPKIKEKLVNDRDMAFLSKDLATIDTKVPISIDYDRCLFSEPNLPELYRLFKKLEFQKFMTKYNFASVADTVSLEVSHANTTVDLTIEKKIIVDATNLNTHWESIKKALQEEKQVSYLFNSDSSEYFSSNLYLREKKLLALYFPTLQVAYLIHLQDISSKLGESVETDILRTFATASIQKMGYQMKQDMLYFFNHVCEAVYGFSYDIMIAYYLMDASRQNYLIDYILDDLYHVQISKETTNASAQLSLFEEEAVFLEENQIKNIELFLKGIAVSYDTITEKLKELEMLTLFDTIEMPLAETLANMEHVGMYINMDMLNIYDEEITAAIAILEKEIYQLAGEEFNINSPQQLGVILFEKLGLPTAKKTKTGYSTDKSVLEKLSEYHPIIEHILKYRQVIKLKGTYVDGLRNKIASDGRIHTTFMQTIASTGRLSSVEPNLQNIPIRLELGRKIRCFFTAEENNVILDADYSQIELRVLAHISNDQTMIDSFNHDIDIHRVTASQVFGVPLAEVTSEMRSHAKAVNFGIVYGISEFGLAKNVGTSRAKAKEYIENYLAKYNGIHDFMENIVEEAKEKGYVATIFGRRRYIPELKQKNKNIIQFGERVAMNTPIQGSAADIIKIAMNRLYQTLKENHMKSKLVMQVHDELIVEAVPEEKEVVSQMMHEAMEQVTHLKVPLSIDLNEGKSWYDAK